MQAERAGTFEGLVSAGGTLQDALWGALAAAALPLALVGAIALAVVLARPGARGTAAHVAAALLLAFGSQALLLGGAPWLGAAGLALALVGYAVQRGPARELAQPLPRGVEGLGALALLGVFAAACLVRLGVYPDLYFDEVAYLRAARMTLGQLEPGPILVVDGREVYRVEQFRAQAIPLLLQTLLLRSGAPALLSLRLLSVALAGATLVVAALALRRRAGAVVALWMLALAAGAPLLLLYGRTGLYIAASLLHGALCFALLLRLPERWTTASAILLGAALGSSLYLYQLSWFVPILAGAAALSTPRLWRRPGARRIAVQVVATAAVVTAPGLLLNRDGFDAVNAQTFDRAVWNRPIGRELDAALVVPSAEAEDEEVAAYVTRVEGPRLRLRIAESTGGRSAVVIEGAPERVRDALGLAEEAGWDALSDPWSAVGPGARLARMLAQLFRGPSPETAGRWVDAPLLNPLVAPLLLLGLVEAARRRRQWVFRLLLVWVVLGMTLPAVVGGVFPRRALLMLPFAWALSALPLLELTTAVRGRAARLAVGIAVAVFAVAVFATNVHLYFTHWDQRVDVAAHERGVLALAHTLAALPAEEAVLVPDLYRGYQVLALREASGREVFEHEEATTPESVRAISCQQATPFTWATFDTPPSRALFRSLERDFLLRTDGAGAFHLVRVVVRKQDGCAPVRRGRSRP